MSTTFLFSEIGNKNTADVGINAALLGELLRHDFIITEGFVISAKAIAYFDLDLKGANSTQISSGLLRDIDEACAKLDHNQLKVSISIIADQMDAYSSLSVFSSYEVSRSTIWQAIQERIIYFKRLKTALDGATRHPYKEKFIQTAIMVQKYEKTLSAISYTYDLDQESVYIEYGYSLETLRNGRKKVYQVVMSEKNLELSLLLVPRNYQQILKKLMSMHNKISKLFSVPLEICWQLNETLQITGIRVVQQCVKEFAP